MVEGRRRRKQPDGFNWGRFIGIFFYTTLLLLLLLTSGAYTFWWSLNETDLYGDSGVQEEEPPKMDERVKVLVMGVDEGVAEDPNSRARGRSDTMMVVAYDPETEDVNVLSIPRDSKIELPGHGTQKINAAYAYGGTSMALQAVEDLLGTGIDYYVVMQLDGFKNLVDTLGGVTVEVEERLYYHDPGQNLLIDFQPGVKHLDGQRAMEFVRFRGREGDLGRVERQQQFIKALAEQAMKTSSVAKIPQLARDIASNLETNIGIQRMVQYGELMRSLESPDMEIETLAGEAMYIQGISYFVVDEIAIEEQVQRLLLGVDQSQNQRYSVRVLNGGGAQGAATATAEELRRAGFTVVDVGNADSFGYEQTVVIPHCENPEPGHLVARTLEVKRVTDPRDWQGTSSVPPDVTVVVGQDWIR